MAYFPKQTWNPQMKPTQTSLLKEASCELVFGAGGYSACGIGPKAFKPRIQRVHTSSVCSGTSTAPLDGYSYTTHGPMVHCAMGF